MGVSARTSAGVYTKDDPARDHLGFVLLPDPAAAAHQLWAVAGRQALRL
jgi:hypothetical protein